MKYKTIRITGFLEADKILGVDGRVYRVGYGMIVTLPKLNADVFLKRGVAEPVDEADLFLEEAML